MLPVDRCQLADKIKQYIAKAKRINLDMVDYEYKYSGAETYEFIQPTLPQQMKTWDDLEECTIEKTIQISNPKYEKLIAGEDLETDVFIVNDVCQVAQDVIMKTKTEICHNKVNSSNEIISFVHPLNGKIIEGKKKDDK